MSLMQLICCLCLHLLVIDGVAASSASECSTNKLVFRPYPFQPNCSQKSTTTLWGPQNCMMAAAVLTTPSAVIVRTGGQCEVMAALCPRYTLTNQSASLLMPSSLTALEHIVFSVKSGCGHKVWDLFINPSAPNSEYVVQPAHPHAAMLPDAFRSSLLDNMQRLISRLIYKHFIVQLYMNSSVVVRLVFDVGVSSESVTSLNWFDKTRLIESWPVTNLASMKTNFFSIKGHFDNGLSRRFFINYIYGNCPHDKGFMIILDDTADGCPKFRYSGEVPKIVYNPFPERLWEDSVLEAEYMAVVVR